MPDSTGALINQLMNPPDPFARLGSMAQGMSAARQFQADQAAADAYRQSIDPETGQFDQAKFNSIASQAPGGSFNFGRQMQSAGTGLQAQSAGTSASLDAQAAKLNGIAGQLYPLMQKVLSGQTVSGAELQETVDRTKALGLTTPDMLANMQKQIDGIKPGGNANGIVQGAMYGTLTAAERYRALTPPPVAVTQGPNVRFVQPQPGAAQPAAGPVPLGLGPEARANQQRWLDEPGEFQDKNGNTYRSRRDMFQANGINPDSLIMEPAAPLPATVGGAPGAGAGPGGPASTVTTGRAPVAPPASGTIAVPQRSVTQPPARQAPVSDPAMPAETAAEGRKAYDADLSVQRTLPQRITPLTQALGVLRTHKNLETVGQEELTQVQQVMNAYGFPTAGMNNANALQMLGKNLAQYTAQLPGANRSDMASLGSAAQTPHIGQGREVIEKLLVKAVGLERMRGSAVDYFHAQYPSPEEAAKHTGQYKVKTNPFVAQQMPDAYALDQMTPDQLHEFVKGLSPADLKQFKTHRAELNKLYPEIKLQPPPSKPPPPPRGPVAIAPIPPP